MKKSNLIKQFEHFILFSKKEMNPHQYNHFEYFSTLGACLIIDIYENVVNENVENQKGDPIIEFYNDVISLHEQVQNEINTQGACEKLIYFEGKSGLTQKINELNNIISKFFPENFEFSLYAMLGMMFLIDGFLKIQEKEDFKQLELVVWEIEHMKNEYFLTNEDILLEPFKDLFLFPTNKDVN